MRSTFLKTLAVAALVVLVTAAVKADTAKPPPLPPGMTPAVYKMMMTLGPAHPAGLPANLSPVSGCIPTMGYHYAVPSTLPFGPIYGWYNGKVTFTEIMVAKTSFENGMSWSEQLKPLPGQKIDHVDVWFEAHGHPGYEVPHYDIHAWYVTHDEHMHYCGNTSGKKPTWL
jgi:hypothetical protein